MKCNKCGFEQTEDFVFCPQCGNPSAGERGFESNASYQAPPKVTNSAKTTNETSFSGNINYVPGNFDQPPRELSDLSAMNPWQRANAMFRDGKFLGVCILLSVNVLMSFITIIPFGVSVIKVLLTIFFWIAYAAAYKYRIEPKHIRWISGTVAAKKIVQYVIVGIVIAVGIAFMALMNSAGVVSLLEDLTRRTPQAIQYIRYIEPVLSASGALVLVLCIVIALVIFLFTFFGMRSFHLFVRSVYRSVEAGSFQIQKRGASAAWFIVYAVFAGLGALGGIINILGTISSITQCVMYVLMSLLVNKYYKDM
ncbi:MAG: hypothetical protein IK152_10610 [Lachnospiraceae bacterium]|nr:hypothetical protein [Lachnospiraceae bacterium]